MWTPYQMEIIMHHYVSKAIFPRATAPLYSETLSELLQIGVIDYEDGIPIVTQKGAALVDMWLQTPLPHMRWADPRTGETIDVVRNQENG